MHRVLVWKKTFQAEQTQSNILFWKRSPPDTEDLAFEPQPLYNDVIISIVLGAICLVALALFTQEITHILNREHNSSGSLCDTGGCGVLHYQHHS